MSGVLDMIRKLFSKGKTSIEEKERLWMEREEERQLEEVSRRLDRVRRILRDIDQHGGHRDRTH